MATVVETASSSTGAASPVETLCLPLDHRNEQYPLRNHAPQAIRLASSARMPIWQPFCAAGLEVQQLLGAKVDLRLSKG
jgi:hypothetical protein